MATYSSYPQPTVPPSAMGVPYYLPMSSATNPLASNYQVPINTYSTQLNAYGAPLSSGSVLGTTTQVVKTNPSTGEFLPPSSPPPPAPPAPRNNSDMLDSGQFGDPNPGIKSWQTILAETGGTGRYGGGGPSEADLALDRGYSDYFRMLDEQLSGLDPQKSSQEQFVNQQADQSRNIIQNQYTSGQAQLSDSRAKTLADLGENLRSSWQQGNAFLGTRGASDSSAPNQYAFALAKEGNRARGDVQTKYDQQLFQLKNVVDSEINKLEMDKSAKLQQVAQWYAEAQNALRQQKGQAALQKSQQALSIAMQMAQQVQQENASRRQALDQWALNNATSMQQLQAQLAQNAQFTSGVPAIPGITGNNQVGNMPLLGLGSSQDTRRDIFGNPIK